MSDADLSSYPEIAMVPATEPLARSPLLQDWRRLLWQIPSAGLIWLSLVQWPVPPADGLDPSWQLLLSDVWIQGRQFGTEFIFTWGPWGFLFQPYVLPEVIGLKEAFELLAKPAVAVAIIALATALDPFRRTLLIVVVLSMGAVVIDSLMAFLAVAAICRWMIGRMAPWWQLAATVLALAFLSLVKFTSLMLAVAGMVLAVTASLAEGHRRRAGAIATLYLGGVLAFWVGAGQHPSGLPAFLSLGLAMSAGYGQAMAVDESPQTFANGVAVLMTMVVWIGFWLWLRRANVEAWAMALVVLAGTYLAWKHGFTRADGHVVIFFVFAALLATAMPAVLPGATAIGPAALVVLLAAAGVWRQAPHIVLSATEWAQARIVDSARRYAGAVAWREAQAAQTKATMERSDFPRTAAAVGNASVDMIDFDQAVVLRHGWNYAPRPVPQSYVAYTPPLLRKNLAFIESSRGPEYLLVGAASMDNRYLGQTDSLLLAEIPRRYEMLLEEGGYILLKRRASQPAPGSVTRTPVRSYTAAVGDIIDLPQVLNHALWLDIQSSPTVMGQLRSLLYKPATVTLMAENDTERGRFRLVPGIAAAGFVLQPFLAQQHDLAAFFQGRGVRRALRLRLEAAPGETQLWRPFTLNVSQIDSMPIDLATAGR
jgi:hypothetical protein